MLADQGTAELYPHTHTHTLPGILVRVSLCSPGRLRIGCVDQAGPSQRSAVSASLVLELKGCTTISGSHTLGFETV